MSTDSRLRRTDHPAPSWELSGPPGAPVIVVLGGISASRHVTATTNDTSDGWWQLLVGPAAAVDTRRFRVLGIDWLAPEQGSISTHDQADALLAVLDQVDGLDWIRLMYFYPMYVDDALIDVIAGARRIDAQTWELAIDARRQGNYRNDPSNILFVGGPALLPDRIFDNGVD